MSSDNSVITCRADLKNLSVTVMGLGLHGGGIASARFLAESGAKVTVTDLRDEKVLEKSIASLQDYDIRYVLGRHDEEDFLNADLVIKNPGVPSTSPFLRLCEQVETDISIFLRLCANPVYAITGSKGKSTSVSALYHIFRSNGIEAFLGGNITVSPLTFYDQAIASPEAPAILELSSWQLHDIPGSAGFNPHVSVITNIMKDHQNSYTSMRHYMADKELIYAGQTPDRAAVFNYDDPHTVGFAAECRAERYFVSDKPLPGNLDGAWKTGSGLGMLRIKGREHEISLENPHMPGIHSRRNLLQAALIAGIAGLETLKIEKAVRGFEGIAHRMEKLSQTRAPEVSVYNDSAATIPDATAAALKSFSGHIVLISGGTDKNIDFSVVAEYASIPSHTVFLAGSATDKMIPYFNAAGSQYSGPFDNLEAAAKLALDKCRKGSTLLFSPGATSFGLFLNEFDRGNKFRALFT